MKEYIRIRERQERLGTVLGVVLAAVLHIGAAVTLSFSGLKYIYPPPPESTFLMDFTEEEEVVKPIRRGTQPKAEEVDLSKPVELVQKSQSTYKATAKQNLTPATKQDDFGDVETPKVEEKEEALDPRAAFPGMSKKDTSLTAPHAADEPGQTFKAGHVEGNTEKGRAEGTPNARVKGRNTLGTIPRPTYTVQNEGTVVVSIWVDNYGNVQKAVAGADGTTVTDKNLWAAARSAALKTHFNTAADAPALQEGTITYVFKLK